MYNRKTKQWYIKPKLAEYKTRTVYCIVNKLKMVPSETEKWRGHHEGAQWASCWPWLWSHDGMEEGMSWWARSPLSLEICHIWYWAVNDWLTQVFRCRLCIQTVSTTKLFELYEKLKMKRNVAERLYALWC